MKKFFISCLIIILMMFLNIPLKANAESQLTCSPVSSNYMNLSPGQSLQLKVMDGTKNVTNSTNFEIVGIDPMSHLNPYGRDFASVSENGLLTISATSKHGVKFMIIARNNGNECNFNFSIKVHTAFSDIHSSYAKTPIQILTKTRVFDGYPNNTFQPKKQITREQFAAILYRSYIGHPIGLYLPPVPNNNLDYIDNSDKSVWYYGYVKEMRAYGMNGVGENLFGVGRPVTREQAVKAIIETWFPGYKSLPYYTTLQPISFSDKDLISDWAVESVQAAQHYGIIQGYQNKFNPKETLTREMAAQLLYNTIIVYKKQPTLQSYQIPFGY